MSAIDQHEGVDESLTYRGEAVDEICLDGDDSDGGGEVEEMEVLGAEPGDDSVQQSQGNRGFAWTFG